MKKLYCFDFDGTVTHKDTMFLFLKFCNPKKYAFQFVKHSVLFVFVKLKLANPERVKKSFIASVIGGYSQQKLEKLANQFFEAHHQEIIRSNALEFFESIKSSNQQSYIVTASLDIWVTPFANHLGFGLLATKAEFVEGIFTGNFASRNCNGKEKVNRIKKEIANKHYDKTLAFGDTRGDKEMLDWADESFFRFFE